MKQNLLNLLEPVGPLIMFVFWNQNLKIQQLTSFQWHPWENDVIMIIEKREITLLY